MISVAAEDPASGTSIVDPTTLGLGSDDGKATQPLAADEEVNEAIWADELINSTGAPGEASLLRNSVVESGAGAPGTQAARASKSCREVSVDLLKTKLAPEFFATSTMLGT